MQIPQRFVSNRCLNVYDQSVELFMMWRAVVVYYYTFLEAQEKRKHSHYVTDIYKDIQFSENVIDRIKAIQKEWSRERRVQGEDNSKGE